MWIVIHFWVGFNVAQRRDSDDGVSTKKARVVWSVEMHQQFVQAVNQLGIDSECSASGWSSQKKHGNAATLIVECR